MADREALTFTVALADARQRLDRYLTALGTWGSRSQVQRLIAAGMVCLDGEAAKAGAVLKAGQQIEVQAPPRVISTVAPEPIPLDVLYEDPWLLIINKPAGLVVHPAPGHWQGTLVSALLHRWQGHPTDLDPLRPGIVHRLDKDTSGVIVIAKDQATLTELGRQFQAREVEKEYLAVVWGTPVPRRGEVAQPIARHPVQRKRMSVRQGGRAAVTKYEVIGHTATHSLVRVRPETGRTHQIRVHLASIGHPVVGDSVYGGRRKLPEGLPMRRQALHALALTLSHPQHRQPIAVTAPLPADLVHLIDHLGLPRLTSQGPSSTVPPQRAPSPSGTKPTASLGTARSSHHASPKLRSLREERM